MKTGPGLNETAGPEWRSATRQGSPQDPVVQHNAEAKLPMVSLHEDHYIVDFGKNHNIRFHQVGKNKECSCGVPDCEAIEAVRQYLLAGGRRAEMPPEGSGCPICGSKTYPDHTWDGKYTRTFGWRCVKGGLRHFLEAKAKRIQKQQAENPWLIWPAMDYPGLRRDDLMTSEQCEAMQRKVFPETGHDPTA
jgi:hypothetical protein